MGIKLCKYYELHQDAGYDIENLYSKKEYDFYKSILNSKYNSSFSGVVSWTKENYFSQNEKDFVHFAHSRKSNRNYTGEKFSHELLDQVIELANTAPSVCNRQSWHAHLFTEESKVLEVLSFQGGHRGFTESIKGRL